LFREVLTVYEADGALDGGLGVCCRNYAHKTITPPEALRHVERGAISPIRLFGKMKRIKKKVSNVCHLNNRPAKTPADRSFAEMNLPLFLH